MKKLIAILTIVSAGASPYLFAGVVLEMVTENASGEEIETTRIFVKSGQVRIDSVDGKRSSEMSMIFRDEEFLILNHKDKTFTVMDEAMFDEMNAQMSEATRQMEEQLAQVPPEQRAMIERMMKGRMNAFVPGQQQAPPALRVKALGSSEWDSYSCTQYEVRNDTGKVQEICAASMDQIEGSGEVMGAFKKMAEFMKRLTASLPGPFTASMASNPMEMMDQIEGFPVHTLHFDDGKLRQEVALKSATKQSLEQDIFTPPRGYKRQDLMQR